MKEEEGGEAKVKKEEEEDKKEKQEEKGEDVEEWVEEVRQEGKEGSGGGMGGGSKGEEMKGQEEVEEEELYLWEQDGMGFLLAAVIRPSLPLLPFHPSSNKQKPQDASNCSLLISSAVVLKHCCLFTPSGMIQ